MKKQEKINFLPALLLALFCLSVAARVAHHLFFHAAHEHEICTDFQTDFKTTHLHDERYHLDDCSVCAFIFSVPEFVSMSALVFSYEKLPDSVQVYEENEGQPRNVDSLFLRGPPAVI